MGFWFIFVSLSLCSENLAQLPTINSIRVEPLNSFPMELRQKAAWRMTPLHGVSYDNGAGFVILLDGDVIGSWTGTCSSLLVNSEKPGPTVCDVERGAIIQLLYTPVTKDYGKRLLIRFFPNIQAVYSKVGQVLVNTTVQLTRQPKYLNLTLTILSESDYVGYAPSGLNLGPPTFLDGSLAKLGCVTDGALPPAPISFSVSCPPPPRAAVEHERRQKARQGYPYDLHYRYYDFLSPPTDEELGNRLAIEFAKGILKESRISNSRDNLTLSATIPIDSKAHDCVFFCRLMGKEEQIRLTVYYQTTLAYLLPTPKDGLMYAGSSMSCYADGYPNPSISLYLKQPLHQFKTEPMLEPGQYSITTSPMPPTELLVLDEKSIGSTTRIGLRPDEYSIRGPHLTLSYNATPGVELLLLCAAGNALPGAIDFIGANKTITTARFVVAAVSYSSIGIVLGICLAILLIAIIIITAMVVLRRRQKYAANAINTRSTAGTNGSKLPPHSGGQKQSDYAAKGSPFDPVQPSFRDNAYALSTGANLWLSSHPYYFETKQLRETEKLHTMRSSLVDKTDPSIGVLQDLLRGSADAIYDLPDHNTSPATRGYSANNLALRHGPISSGDNVDYAHLDFSHTNSNMRTFTRPPIGGPSTSGATSGSMSYIGGTRHRRDEFDDDTANYSEIVGIMRPKEYSSQLILQQQQEATHALLNRNCYKKSELV